MALSKANEVQIAIVVLASRYRGGVRALAETFDGTDPEDSTDGAAVLSNHAIQTHVVLAAVVGMGVAGEGASGGQHTRGGAREVLVHRVSLSLALGNVVHPVADSGDPVVGEARGALVAGGLAAPTRPEHGAVVGVSEDAVQVGAVGGGDGGLQMGPSFTVHGEEVVAILSGIVRVVEG